jgi:AraC-like DNA-binding protein
VRRRQAARHLANPRLTVTEVAELSGYASLSAFTRWHTQAFGMSPQHARNRTRAQNLPISSGRPSGHGGKNVLDRHEGKAD